MKKQNLDDVDLRACVAARRAKGWAFRENGGEEYNAAILEMNGLSRAQIFALYPELTYDLKL